MNVILCSFPNISQGNIKPQTANLPLSHFCSNYNMKSEGGNLKCLHRDGTVASVLHCKQQQHEDPCASTRVPIMSNFLPVDIPVCAYAQIPFEKGNLMVIVMNVDFTDQKGRRKEMREILREGEVCLDARVSFGFTRRNDLGET